jgi:hypothetical protein
MSGGDLSSARIATIVAEVVEYEYEYSTTFSSRIFEIVEYSKFWNIRLFEIVEYSNFRIFD